MDKPDIGVPGIRVSKNTDPWTRIPDYDFTKNIDNLVILT
jgi:hypothetical protein